MAGSIDNLNFEIILSDAKFDAKIKEVENKAKKFNTSLSNILNINKISTQMSQKDVENARRVWQAKVDEQRAQEKINREKVKTEGLQRKINAQIDRATKGYNQQSRILQELKGYALGYLSIHGATQLLSSLVRVTGEFELQKTTLAAMLGDLNKAEQVITRIQGLAVESPFQFKELTTYAKQLSAFSVPAEELYETTKMLADISAGLGVGMDRIVLAYGQVRSAAFLRGQEVRQFTEAGIPILDELAKQFTELEGRAVSTGEVFDKISARLVPFEMVAKVMRDLTSEGGKFYQMQEVQAETLRGKISNLKDAYEVMLNEIGSAHSDKLKGAVDELRSLMQNWEAIGSQIVYLIKLFGAYKAAVGLLTISDTIAQFGGLTKALKQTAIAQKLLNSALLTNPYIAVGTAILGIVMALRNATKASREFKAEIDKIANIQYGEADKAVDRYNKLTNELKSATKGSHDYREAISKLNNEYGEYLPELLNEKNALDLIKTSSDAVTASIYNRARARAYERAQQKTEDLYGESRDYYTSVFLQKLRDDGISEKAARDLFHNFNEAIKDQAEGWYPAEVFNQVYKAYFSTTEDYFTEVGNALNDIKQNTPFIRNIYGVNTTGWMTARDALWNYALVQNKVLEAEKDYNNILEARWGNGAKSDAESKKLSQIAAWYNKQTAAINAAEMSEQERIERLKNLDISKLQLLVQLYEELDKNPNTARADLLNKYRDELSALTKQLDGWQKKVADALNPYGIKGKGAGDYGLFADENTSYLEYIQNLRNSYKGLAQQIADTAKANPKLNAELKKQKEVIEAVAQALNIDLMLSTDTIESKEEKRIKRLVDALRTLQDQYEKLKEAGASDKSIKTLFEGLYPDLIKENGKEFVTDLNYLERAIGLVAELEKIAPDDAKKLLVGLGKDEFSVYLKNLQEQKNIASAAKEYFNILRKWKAEDFNLEGEGISFDIDKISTGFASKVGEIDLKTRKLKELFDQIGISDTSKRSEEAIASIKKHFEKEFGEGSWDKFYEEFLSKGDSAFKTLADKEIAYERKIAQEKITNLAKAYVGDMTEKLDMSDWSDKSLGQIEFIRSELMKLMKSDIPISDSLRKELELLGLNTDDLIAKIKELFGGKFDTATIEKIKAVQEVAKGVSSYSKMVGESLATLGESMNSDFLTGAAKAVSLLGDMADAIMESESLMAKLTLEFGDVSNLSEEATENLENIAKSSDWITVIIKVILSAVTAVSNVIATQRKNMELAVDAVIAYRDALAEIARENANTIFGTKQISILVENLNAASEAYRFFKKELDNAMSQDRGEGGWYLPSIGGEGGEGYWFETYKDLKSLLGNETFENEKELMEYLKANIDYWESLTHFSDGERTTAQLETEIRNLIKVYDAWDKANKLVEASMTELFGKLGDDIASNMINSFLEVGKATANLEESFESLGETILQSFLKTAIIEDVLMPRLEAISDLMTEAVMKEIPLEEFASQLGNVAEEIKSDLTEIGPIWEQIFASFQENGLLPDSQSAASNLGAGIKGITEDTANLLASYLNAIRADVSYAKSIWERMDKNTQAIASAIASFPIPSLMEYQAQIAANTYNTAIHTQEIMYSLRSVLTSEDGPAAIRVLS